MSLEQRVQRLEDRAAIAELRAAYCYRIDDGDWEGWLDLFSPDATVDFGLLGTYKGREELQAFTDRDDASLFSAHMAHNPVLEVDGDEANGKWYFEVPLVFADGEAGWAQGRYRERYRRIEREWKFARLKARFDYSVSYEEGWADAIE
jgi:hypothetical protein